MLHILPRHLEWNPAGQHPDPDLRPAVDPGDEGDHLPVWRQRRRLLRPDEICQPLKLNVACSRTGLQCRKRLALGSAERLFKFEACVSDVSQPTLRVPSPGIAPRLVERQAAWVLEVFPNRAHARESLRSCPLSCHPRRRRARSTSRRPRNRRPRCRFACRRAGRAPVRDSCRQPYKNDPVVCRRRQCGSRSQCRRLVLWRRRKSKVSTFDSPVCPQLDVRRFQITVNDGFSVRRLECVGDLAGDRHRLVDWDWPGRDAIGERWPFDQLDTGLERRHSPPVRRCSR